MTFHSVKSYHYSGTGGGFPMIDATTEHGTRGCRFASMTTCTPIRFDAGAGMNRLGYGQEL